MMKLFSAKHLRAIAMCAAIAQSAQPPTFEVASVKLAATQQSIRGSTGIPEIAVGSILPMTHVTLVGLLVRAYRVEPSQVVGPSWLNERFYDIVAKVPQGASRGQIPEMLQGLLAERFRMRVHWDTRQTAGYILVAGRRGPNLKRSPSSASDSDGASDRHESIRTYRNGVSHLEYKGVTLGAFAKSLTVLLDRPVADETGIEGVFDFALDCSSDSLVGLRMTIAEGDPAAEPPILTAIRKLGLALVSQREPIKLLVVDSAEKNPTEN